MFNWDDDPSFDLNTYKQLKVQPIEEDKDYEPSALLALQMTSKIDKKIGYLYAMY